MSVTSRKLARFYLRTPKLRALEGIVAKRADSLYYRGRDSGWLKIKTAAGRATDEERRKWNE